MKEIKYMSKRLHCLKFTERNFTMGVHVFNKPYFHVSLGLKCSYQSSLSKIHNFVWHKMHTSYQMFTLYLKALTEMRERGGGEEKVNIARFYA